MMRPSKKMEANETYIEALMERIKNYRILYDTNDPNYKDVRMKDRVWDTLAATMPCQTNRTEIKKRWKNLRDSYSKYLRAHRGVNARYISNYKCWPWAEQMSYFKPYLSFVQTYKDETESSPLLIKTNKKIKFAKKRKFTETSSEVQNVSTSYLDFLDRDKNSNTHDDIDLVFLGYAASVKKLSSRRQSLIKFEIAKLIMEEELNELKQKS